MVIANAKARKEKKPKFGSKLQTDTCQYPTNTIDSIDIALNGIVLVF